MPNGKGSLDCSYCKHFNAREGYPVDFGDSKLCGYHKVILPQSNEPHMNRICCHFEPNETFYQHNAHFWMPLFRRVAWFGIDMEPGVLYEFSYNNPEGIKKTAILRTPDYQNDCWKE